MIAAIGARGRRPRRTAIAAALLGWAVVLVLADSRLAGAGEQLEGEASGAAAPGADAPKRPVLRIQQQAEDSVIAGRKLRWRLDIRNLGRGTARSMRLKVDEGDLTLAECVVDGDAVDCTDLRSRGADIRPMRAGSRSSVDLRLAAPVDAPRGHTTLRAWVTGPRSAAAPRRVTHRVKVRSLPAPVVDSPRTGARTAQRRPMLTGRGDPLSRVTITRGEVTVCAEVPVRASGAWRCRPATPFPRGKVRLKATQTDTHGIGSRVSTTVFHVGPREPKAQEPPATPVAGPPESRQEPAPQPSPQVPGSEDVAPTAPPAPTPPTGDRRSPPPRPRDALQVDLHARPAPSTGGSGAQHGGRLGPNVGDRPLRVKVVGRLFEGARYRAVSIGDLRCTVAGRTFACRGTLAPGATAPIAIRTTPGASASPSGLVQQVDVSTPDGLSNNSVVQRRTTARRAPDGSLHLQLTSAPGPTVVLLALLLLALAAHRHGQRSAPTTPISPFAQSAEPHRHRRKPRDDPA